MRVINIYVEGKGDMAFVGHFLTKHFNYYFTYDFKIIKASATNELISINIQAFDSSTCNGGIDGKKISELINEIKTVNINTGIESVIIIDADTDNHKHPVGGCSNRKDYLNKLIDGADIKYFVIPNNNDDGNLENLLHGIISDKGTPFYSYLYKYVDCLTKITGNIPIGIKEISDFNKQRMEWYTYVMLGKDEKKRDYSNELWNLDSSNLYPLKEFFSNCLKGF